MTTDLAWPVTEDAEGTRLDHFVATRVDAARHQVQRWIDQGRVAVNDRPGKSGLRLRCGDTVTCSPPPPVVDDPRVVPEAGLVDVLFEDDHVTVVDKPAGLAVHPGAGLDRGTLVNRLLCRDPGLAGVGGPGRPGIVHRLDKDTTGVLVIARTPASYRALVDAFGQRQVDKRYLAVVYGRPSPAAGIIDFAVGRDPRDRKRMAVRADDGGRPARTAYGTVASAHGVALLALDIETGRTHQIRVHAKAIGHPLVGDPTYGEARWRGLPGSIRAPLRDFARPALHARRLAFPHPVTGERIHVEAPVPDDLSELWHAVTGQPWPSS